ncbi:DEAD/DEAH box helicase [Salipaludibacillus sp. CUR1]|uniref:DEAD/DEAH box helicase n=1 Tax=Salipaludibacillus sp. CUR1 TaxID=2820003 RepID=UPI001E3B770D|nr:DEAD/DEAH box helicase [Salipaludibacillus sp. CUR1]MCE7792206.1 DEAD/DEAH box helicase [Salipaludibacillus sp. CUR1]
MINLASVEKEILSGLKDFQQATVERVDQLYKGGYSKVLVADEVGLGKTLVARGVIAKTAYHSKENLNKPIFKVVYVCSNQSIAGQNLAKLKIDQKVTVEGLSDTRLSMQHLKIFEQQYDENIQENFIQLIPLTPATSFSMTGGPGNASERALIFAVLKRHKTLAPYLEELEVLLTDQAEKSWPNCAVEYEGRVLECNRQSGGEYINVMLHNISKHFSFQESLTNDLEETFHSIRKAGYQRVKGSNKVIHQLRIMMAKISVELLNADLVIMDEFQRFPDLINTDSGSETAMLAKKFFNNDTSVNPLKILLLSATPYKLYSTLEEINESKSDDHYKEFMQVIDFLFSDNRQLKKEFRNVWNSFSLALNEVTHENFAIISAEKQKAEEYLFKGICRTERLSVKEAEQLVQIYSPQNQLTVSEDDILSYMEADQLLKEINPKETVPVDYIKSAPYIFSFMQHYKLKERIFNHFAINPQGINLAKKQRLWINRNSISKYKELPKTNARMEKLKEITLPKGAEHLMWIPPSKPYYDYGGCFKGQRNFSKVLVFSAWEMVPRAIGALISYESERRTVGKLISKTPKQKKENRSYFAKNRFPSPRLTFRLRENKPSNMNRLCLLYPSRKLAGLFDPVKCLNESLTLNEVKESIGEKIDHLMEDIKEHISDRKESLRQDERWYYIAPLLFDKADEEISGWLENLDLTPIASGEGTNQSKEDTGAYRQHFEELKKIYFSEDKIALGKKPKDLKETLVNMALGSPAICALRMFGISNSASPKYAVQLAKGIVDRFNIQEAIAIVELNYGRGKEDKDAHWQNVLSYCVDGNIQAMLDEYSHMLLEGNNLNNKTEHARNERLLEIMVTTLKTHTASYNVDTFQSFKGRVMDERKKSNKKQKEENEKYIKMRSSYAVGFYDTKNEGRSVQRKDNIRQSFNSPFRPFVLASTSIGQEGLDFHYYCRKIAHWNLPSNPVDIEQREGRINRYKSLAIRQNIAHEYGKMKFKENIWDEMFEQAQMDEKKDGICELVPFWSLTKSNAVNIERILLAYPLSKDNAKYERLIKILSLYRLSLGQARQEELLEYIIENDIDEDKLQELFINLSPYYKINAE